MGGRYIVVPDSFKGCLSSQRVAEAVAEGLHGADASADVTCINVSDGGEGMLDAVVPLLGAEVVTCNSFDPLMRRIEVRYGVSGDTAVIESALCCGMSLLTKEELNPLVATTYGLGVVIADAVKRGCHNIIVGLGGSATCDAGVGMLKAINEKFSADGHFDDKVRKALSGCRFTILADVVNPLLGAEGAAHVFAPQKGASAEDVEFLEWRISKFATMSAKHFGYDRSSQPSAGAAGGLGYAFIQYLDAEVRSGADYILDLNHFDEKVAEADAVITGEGSADAQTLMGKLPYKVLKRSAGVPVCLIAGKVSDNDRLTAAGFKSVNCINPEDMPLEECLKPETAYKNIVDTVKSVFG